MTQGMRTTFLVHAIVALIFGLGLFLIPTTFLGWFNWTPVDATMSRFFGAACLGLAVSSWMAYRAGSLSEVRVKLWLEIVYGVLGALAGLYSVLFADAPATAWIIIILLGGFGILWIYLYRGAQ